MIGGYVDRAGTRNQVGSLLLGVYDDGKLIPVGSVGTGWSAKEATALKTTLSKLERPTMPFALANKPGRWSKRAPGDEIWVEPKLIAEVEFSEWTPDGHIRHPSFIGLRADKHPAQVVREIPGAAHLYIVTASAGTA